MEHTSSHVFSRPYGVGGNPMLTLFHKVVEKEAAWP